MTTTAVVKISAGQVGSTHRRIVNESRTELPEADGALVTGELAASVDVSALQGEENAFEFAVSFEQAP